MFSGELETKISKSFHWPERFRFCDWQKLCKNAEGGDAQVVLTPTLSFTQKTQVKKREEAKRYREREWKKKIISKIDR